MLGKFLNYFAKIIVIVVFVVLLIVYFQRDNLAFILLPLGWLFIGFVFIIPLAISFDSEYNAEDKRQNRMQRRQLRQRNREIKRRIRFVKKDHKK